jgi:hypothetical protein
VPVHLEFSENVVLEFHRVSVAILDWDACLNFSQQLLGLTRGRPTINTDALPEVASPTMTSG